MRLSGYAAFVRGWDRRLILLLLGYVALVLVLAWLRPDFSMATLLGRAARVLSLMLAALVGLGFLLMPVAMLAAGAVLPAEPRLENAAGAEPPGDFDRAALAAGFRPARPPADLNTRPPTRHWIYVHDREPVLATAARVGDRIVTGLFSRLDAGILETATVADLDRIPIPPFVVRQVIEHAPLPALLAHHERALGLAAAHGRPALPLPSDGPDSLLLEVCARARAFYRAHPVRCGVLLWIRTLFLWSPNRGPLADRDEEALARVLARRAS